jgi:hypothetical protein
MTREYSAGKQSRYIEQDVVSNQNGVFKWIYDNGPGLREWAPFSVICDDSFASYVGGMATVQYGRLLEMWNYIGTLGMKGPDGAFKVAWASNSIEPKLRYFPQAPADPPVIDVVVQFEEAS